EQSPLGAHFAHGGNPGAVIQKTAVESPSDKTRQILARGEIGYGAFAVSRLVKPGICVNAQLWPKKHQLAIKTMAQLRDHLLQRQQPSLRVSAVGTMLVLSSGNLAETVKCESNARHDPSLFL